MTAIDSGVMSLAGISAKEALAHAKALPPPSAKRNSHTGATRAAFASPPTALVPLGRQQRKGALAALAELYPLSTRAQRRELLEQYVANGRAFRRATEFEQFATRWDGAMGRFRVDACDDPWPTNWRRYFQIAQADAASCMFSWEGPCHLQPASSLLADDFLAIVRAAIDSEELPAEHALRPMLARQAAAPQWPVHWLRCAYLLGAAACCGALHEVSVSRLLDRLGPLYASWRLSQSPSIRLAMTLTGKSTFEDVLAPALVAMVVLLQPRVELRSKLHGAIPGLQSPRAKSEDADQPEPPSTTTQETGTP